MDLAQFAALHVPTLAAYEVRFSIHIALLTSTEMEVPLDLRLWSLGAPGHCAMQWPGRAILLGDLDRAECQQFAEANHGHWRTRRCGYGLLVKRNKPFEQHRRVGGAHCERRAPSTGIASWVREHMRCGIGSSNSAPIAIARSTNQGAVWSAPDVSQQDCPSGPLHRAMARRSQRPKPQVQWYFHLS